MKVEESKVKFKSKRRKASSGKKEIMRSVNKEKVAELDWWCSEEKNVTAVNVTDKWCSECYKLTVAGKAMIKPNWPGSW